MFNVFWNIAFEQNGS